MALDFMPDGNSTIQVGVIADTHGLLRPEAIAALRPSDLILHAGDIGKPDVLEPLRAIAPVVAIRGNVDSKDWAMLIPEQETIRVANVSIHLLHNLKTLTVDLKAAGIQVVVSGHSHQPVIAERDGVLFLNPGSAGPRRFKLPISIAHLYITGTAVSAELIELVV